jgi:hypothetical protein
VHVRTHQRIAIAVYDALPRAAQEFYRLSDVELRFWSRDPDEVAGDNILVTGCDEEQEQYAHSYKLERQSDGALKHLVGSAPTVIGQTTRLCRNAVREGRFEEARKHAGLLMHYAADLTTIWHLTRELTATQHKEGEGQIARALDRIMPGQEEWQAFRLPEPKSLEESAVEVAKETVRQQLDRVLRVQAAGPITKDPELCREMLARCCGFTLAAELYVWRFVERA